MKWMGLQRRGAQESPQCLLSRGLNINVTMRGFITGAGGRGPNTALRVFTAVLHKENDLYVAECPEVGTVSQRQTIEEAVANLQEATELYLEEFPLGDVSRPWVTTFEAHCA